MESRPLVTVTVSEFRQLIKGVLAEVFAEEKTRSGDHVLLNVQEAAALLNIAVATLYGKTSDRLIPHYKHGKKLMFKKSELIAWVETRRIKTLKEIKQEAMTRTR